MNVNGPNFPNAARGAARIPRDGAVPPAQTPAARGPDARPTPQDTVSISDDARRLNAEAGASDGLSPERAAQIRERLLSGAYHSTEMAGLVAQRILESGDV